MSFHQANLQLAMPFLSRLRVRHGTDRRTERQWSSLHNPPPYGVGAEKQRPFSFCLTGTFFWHASEVSRAKTFGEGTAGMRFLQADCPSYYSANSAKHQRLSLKKGKQYYQLMENMVREEFNFIYSPLLSFSYKFLYFTHSSSQTFSLWSCNYQKNYHSHKLVGASDPIYT